MKGKFFKKVDPFTIAIFIFLLLFGISLLYLLFWSLPTV